MKATRKVNTCNSREIIFKAATGAATLKIEINQETHTTTFAIWVGSYILISLRLNHENEITEHLYALAETTEAENIDIKYFPDEIKLFFRELKATISCDYANREVIFTSCTGKTTAIANMATQLYKEFIRVMKMELETEPVE